jgi:hypothetical protein
MVILKRAPKTERIWTGIAVLFIWYFDLVAAFPCRHEGIPARGDNTLFLQTIDKVMFQA